MKFSIFTNDTILKIKRNRNILSPRKFCDWCNTEFCINITPYDFLNCSMDNVLFLIEQKIKEAYLNEL